VLTVCRLLKSGVHFHGLAPGLFSVGEAETGSGRIPFEFLGVWIFRERRLSLDSDFLQVTLSFCAM
jgi:hypothetical protein